MKECARVRKLLSRYLDKETGDLDAAMVRTHSDNCAFCNAELSGLVRIKELIQGKERKTLPRDYLVSRLHEEIALEQRYEERLSWLADMGNFSRRLIPIPVSIIVLSMVLLIFIPGRKPANYRWKICC